MDSSSGPPVGAGSDPAGSGEDPPPSQPAAGAPSGSSPSAAATPSRYESQKRRDWNTFQQYLRNHKPPLTLARCSGAHVIEFLKYLDQFGKTKVHVTGCPFFGQPNPPAPCPCPLRQAWGSLDALIGRLRAAFEENGGRPESNPFAARPVRIYLREVRQAQSKARGVPYEKKKRKRNPPPPPPPPSAAEEGGASGGAGEGSSTSSVPPTTTRNPTLCGDDIWSQSSLVRCQAA